MSDDKHDSDDVLDPIEALLKEDPSPLPPLAVDGGFAPQPLFEQEPMPDANPDNFVCLRGPCQHYFECKNWLSTGNTVGIFEAPPKTITRFCMRMEGAPIPLSEETVFECNQWSPWLPGEQEDLEERRKTFLKIYDARKTKAEQADEQED